MSPQELQSLQTFLAQLTQASAGTKDPHAAALITDAVSRQPDAAYLLVQRAMLLDHALTSAKAHIDSLQHQLQASQLPRPNDFLNPANAWGNSAAGASMGAAMPPPMPATTAPPMPTQSQSSPTSRPGFLSGALGSIATTAAGVAGGAFLFQGIENLFHHTSGNNFLGQPVMGMAPTETTVINNYYGNDDRSSLDANDSMSEDSFLDDSLASDDFVDDDSSVL